MTERASPDKGYPRGVRLLAVLLAGCGFQVAEQARDAGPRDTGATSDTGVDGTGIDAPTDAAIDAPPVAVLCPPSFTVTIAASTSKYRISSTNAVFTSHNNGCNGEVPGATHLAVFDTTAELDQISALLASSPQPTSGRFYVGAVQMSNQTATSTGWLQFTGGAVPATLWTPGQPDDNSDPEANHEQQLAAVDSGARMNDVSGTVGYGAVCECDGKAIDPTAAAFIP